MTVDHEHRKINSDFCVEKMRCRIGFYGALVLIALCASLTIYWNVGIPSGKNSGSLLQWSLKSEPKRLQFLSLILDRITQDIVIIDKQFLNCISKLGRKYLAARIHVTFCWRMLLNHPDSVIGVLNLSTKQLPVFSDWARKSNVCMKVIEGTSLQNGEMIISELQAYFRTGSVRIVNIRSSESESNMLVIPVISEITPQQVCENQTGPVISVEKQSVVYLPRSFVFGKESSIQNSLIVPASIPAVIDVLYGGRVFIPCVATPKTEGSAREQFFRNQAAKILHAVGQSLELIGVPWWISSGTLLGWFRSCDIIPHSDDIDIAIFAHDFREEILSAVRLNGFEIVYRLGLINDSLQMSFVHSSARNRKLDVYFFYKEDDHYWNGATAYKAGQKFKYIFPKFTLCWAEFLELPVRVPCDPLEYIVANYGTNWSQPVTEWDWRTSPPNSKLNGYWSAEERNKTIYLNPKFFADST